MQEKFTELNLVLNECKEKHICPVCGKECSHSYDSTKKKPKWKLFCSNDCKNSILGKEIISFLFKQSMLEKYGVENPSQLEEVKLKKEQTSIKNFGVSNPMFSEEVKNKIKETFREKYNVDCSFQIPEVAKKIEQYNLEHYGTKTRFENKEIRDIAEEKMRETYRNPEKLKEIKEKNKQTMLERYGVDNPLQSEEIRNKYNSTMIERYGVTNPSQSEEIRAKKLITRRINSYEHFLSLCKNKNIEPLFLKDEYINARIGSELKFRCKLCNEVFSFTLDKRGHTLTIQDIHCPNPIHRLSSQYEQEIYDWLKSIGIENIERNKRDWKCKGKVVEADLFLPDYNLVIEFNGIYWHSNIDKDDNYHYNKWKFFKDMNIQCIQIFENEWLNNKYIVKGILLNRLGKSNRIYARQCRIDNVSETDYRIFLDQNHLQGYCKAKVKLGLFYENELVMCMSFSKPRFNKKYDWENIRTCSKIGYSITGGFSKLFSYFKENYKGSIVSYIDSRYFNGNGYIENGFEYAGHSKPNYFYFKNSEINLHNRIEFQKHKLKDKLNVFDENLSEKENMSMNGYLWIYDCGNDVLALNNLS